MEQCSSRRRAGWPIGFERTSASRPPRRSRRCRSASMRRRVTELRRCLYSSPGRARGPSRPMMTPAMCWGLSSWRKGLHLHPCGEDSITRSPVAGTVPVETASQSWWRAPGTRVASLHMSTKQSAPSKHSHNACGAYPRVCAGLSSGSSGSPLERSSQGGWSYLRIWMPRAVPVVRTNPFFSRLRMWNEIDC